MPEHRPPSVDSEYTIYIADTENQRIRKIAADNGIITTIAGNGDRCSEVGCYSGDTIAAIAAARNASKRRNRKAHDVLFEV